jgi:hypothetical protein
MIALSKHLTTLWRKISKGFSENHAMMRWQQPVDIFESSDNAHFIWIEK